MESKTTYLYLARRDKKGIKIISVTNGATSSGRLDSVDSLSVDRISKLTIVKLLEENKMLWELRIDSADTYQDFVRILTKRGYSNLPFAPSTLLSHLEGARVVSVNKPNTKIMTQKKK